MNNKFLFMMNTHLTCSFGYLITIFAMNFTFLVVAIIRIEWDRIPFLHSGKSLVGKPPVASLSSYFQSTVGNARRRFLSDFRYFLKEV